MQISDPREEDMTDPTRAPSAMEEIEAQFNECAAMGGKWDRLRDIALCRLDEAMKNYLLTKEAWSAEKFHREAAERKLEEAERRVLHWSAKYEYADSRTRRAIGIALEEAWAAQVMGGGEAIRELIRDPEAIVKKAEEGKGGPIPSSEVTPY